MPNPSVYVYGPKGEIYDISIAEIQDALQRGEWFDLPPGSIINMGKAGATHGIEFTPENLRNASLQGFEPEGAEVGRERWMRKTYGSTGQQALAAFEGMLSGASLGLSDVIETKVLGVDPREIKARAESGEARTLGEIGGVLATAGIGSGGGAGRGVVRKILGGMPAGQVTKGGTKLARVIREGKAFAKMRPGARELLAKTAMGAFEGSLYGGGAGLSQAMMDNLPLLSEETMGYIGPSMLLGAAGGAGIMGGGELIGMGLRGAGKRAGKLLPQRPAPKGDPYAVGGRDPVTLTPTKWNRFSKLFRGGATLDDQATFVGNPDSPWARKALESRPQTIQKDLFALTGKAGEGGSFGASHEGMDKIIHRWLSEQGAEDLARFIDVTPPPAMVLSRGKKMMSEVMGALKPHTQAEGVIKTHAGKIYKNMQHSMRRLEQLEKDALAGKIAPDKWIKETHKLVDLARRDFGQLADDVVWKAKLGGDQELARQMMDLYTTNFSRFLGDAELFGSAAGIYSSINDLFHTFLMEAEFRPGVSMLKQVAKGWHEGRRFAPDQQGVMSFLEKHGLDPAFNQNGRLILQDFENKLRLSEAISDMLGVERNTISKVRLNYSKSVDHLRRMYKVNALQKSYNALSTGGFMTSAVGMGAAGYAVGHIMAGYPGGLVGGLLGATMVPRNVIGMLRTKDALSQAVGKKLGLFRGLRGASDAMNRQSTAGARALLGQAAKWPFGKGKVPIAIHAFDDFRYEKRIGRAEDPQKGYRRFVAELEHLYSPEAIQERLEANMPGIAQEFPEFVGHMNMLGQRMVEYLTRVAPPELYQDGVELIRGNRVATASRALNVYWKKCRIIENPQLIWALAREGRLSGAEMEAVAAVYPEWLQKQRGRIVEELAKYRGKIPTISRDMIPIIMGTSLGPNSTRWYIEMNQMRYEQTRQAAANPAKPDSQFSGARRMADELKSQMQGLEER